MEAPQTKKRFVLGMIIKPTSEPQDPEFLVINSVSTNQSTGHKSKVQIKFPGGTERLPDEPVLIMLGREILEETYLNIDPNKAVKVWELKVSEEHTKYGFVILFSDCHGELRPQGLVDNNDEISKPYWMRLSELKHVLFPGHQAALTEALRYLDTNPLQ